MMEKTTYIAAIAEYDEDGQLYCSVRSGDGEETMEYISDYFSQEAAEGHRTNFRVPRSGDPQDLDGELFFDIYQSRTYKLAIGKK